MRLRRALGAPLVIGLLFGTLGGPVAAQDAEASHPRPEDAVRAYLAGMAAADLDQVLAATAIDDMAAQVDFDRTIERLRVWLPFQAPLPSDDPFLVELNRGQFTGQIMTQARMLLYSLLTTETLDGSPVRVEDGWAASFRAQLDPARLAGLEVVDIAFPNPDLEEDPRYLDTAAAQAAMFGADELTERVAVFVVGDQAYASGFTLLRYDDSWGVSSATSPLLGISMTGAAVPVTVGLDGEVILPED